MSETLSAEIAETFLPTGQMLQIPRAALHDGARIIGCVDLAPDHWVFDHHFPADPKFPGSLLIEAAGQPGSCWRWPPGMAGSGAGRGWSELVPNFAVPFLPLRRC